ncbi:MAG: PKD domain-containing protein [Candidatus Thermoplasmatota archaeon]|nr:PKD domain-containing protein [Candidatus Thermoplasmatota archaeon]MBU1941212.1 PKD domain-containing protein [Candidatus Thermoplasmatota archaeon]
MKRHSILIIGLVSVMLMSTAAFAMLQASAEFPVLSTPILHVVQVPVSVFVNEVFDERFHVSVLDRSAESVLFLASPGVYQEILSFGYPVTMVYERLEEYYGWTENPELLRVFHDYPALTTELQTIASSYPSIAQLYELGTSVQGRSIWGLKITDNPTIDEDEPEVRMAGLHHGDELMSVELNLNLAWLLVDDYGTDPDITDLVNNCEIWIIPMVNPDGRMASPSPTRYNANGVDLNRDYGYMWAGSGGSPSSFSQPETQTIRVHALEHNFVLSLSFHTTAAYVNYLWNFKPQPSPDDLMIQQLSYAYAGLSGYTAIRGYDWYQTRGDTNDFSYGCRGDIDWTIETGNSDITSEWNKNQQAMLDIIEATDLGLRGIVTDASSSEPIEATVWVEEAYWPKYTDPAVGDYHITLMPGSYTVHFQANGYAEQIKTVTVSSTNQPAVLNAALQPTNQFYAYQVTICEYYAPSGSFSNNPTDGIHALGLPDGFCSSIGRNGKLVLDMGEDTPVFDLSGEPDFKVIEGDGTDDGYSVYAANSWNGPYTFVGTGMGTTTFDLQGTGIDEAQFIRIVDDGDGSASEPNPGCDIDAVQNLAQTNANKSPLVPQSPTGPAEGVTGITYTFSAVTTDPEGEQISYLFDWGDGTLSDWIGPVASGTGVSAEYAWVDAGIFNVRVKASDGNSESAWSVPTQFEVVQGPILEVRPMSSGLFRLEVAIKNSGAVDATDVHWRIELDGGAFIGKSHEGTGFTVPAGGTATIQSGFIFGLGSTVVTTTVEYGDGGVDSRTQNGYVLLFFVQINPSGG